MATQAQGATPTEAAESTVKRKRKGTKPGQPVCKFALGDWEEKGRWALPIPQDPSIRADIQRATTMDVKACTAVYVCAETVRREQRSGAISSVKESDVPHLSWTKILMAARQRKLGAWSKWSLQGAFLVLAHRQCRLLAEYCNFVTAEHTEQAAGCPDFSAGSLSGALRREPSGAVMYKGNYWMIDTSKRQRVTEGRSGTTGDRLYFYFQGHIHNGPHVEDPVERASLGRETIAALERGGPVLVHKLWHQHWERGWLPSFGTLTDGGFKIIWKVPINGKLLPFSSASVASLDLLQGMSDAVCALRDSADLLAADTFALFRAFDDAVAPFVLQNVGVDSNA